MNRFAAFLTALFLGFTLVSSLPAVAAEATQAVNKKQIMKSWREARAKFQTVADAAKADAAKAKLVRALEKSLDDSEVTLEEALDALAGSDQKRIAKAAAALKDDLQVLAANQAKLKGDKQLAGASGNLMNMLGDVLAQQNQATRSAVKNVR